MPGTTWWDANDFEDLLQLKLQGAAVTDIALVDLNCTSTVLNEVMNFVAAKSDGLQKLDLMKFPDAIELDPVALNNLAQKTSILEKLQVQMMRNVSDQAREGLLSMISQIIQTSSSLQILNLRQLGMTVQQSELLCHTLVSSSVNGLKQLDLAYNEQCFADSDSAVEKLCEVIKQQESLEDLSLGRNNLSSTNTTKILTSICESPCFNTIKVLFLSHCSFDTEDSRNTLGKIISEAPLLSKISISDQIPYDRVKVERIAAVSEQQGSVKILDRYSDEQFWEGITLTTQQMKIEQY